jgi:hypothetical protein
MKANVLVVSADEFPARIAKHLEGHGLICFFARGGIKTKEVLGNQAIDAIIWLFLGHERALALDLLQIFNQRPDLPVVLITQNYDELDFVDDVKGLYANLDLNDDIEDIFRAIESSCTQQSPQPDMVKPIEVPDLPEIDFRNAFAQILQNPETPKTGSVNDELKNTPFWNAVDQDEKRMLSEPYREDKKALLQKIRGWLG